MVLRALRRPFGWSKFHRFASGAAGGIPVKTSKRGNVGERRERPCYFSLVPFLMNCLGFWNTWPIVFTTATSYFPYTPPSLNCKQRHNTMGLWSGPAPPSGPAPGFQWYIPCSRVLNYDLFVCSSLFFSFSFFNVLMHIFLYFENTHFKGILIHKSFFYHFKNNTY